jgi:DNA-binding GntR family transcriptional regulator
MSTSYTPMDHLDLTEKTYRLLKDQILKRDMKPGEKIAVDIVADGLGISRTPVVLALDRLANDGLVSILPRRGTFVTELTVRDVVELFDIRELIETYAAGLIIKRGQTQKFLKMVEAPLALTTHAVVNDDYQDYDSFITGDRDMHMSLVSFSDNQHLIHMYESLSVHMQVARFHYLASVESAREAVYEHDAIIKGFLDENQEEVEQALRLHISNVKNRLLAILNQNGGKL